MQKKLALGGLSLVVMVCLAGLSWAAASPELKGAWQGTATMVLAARAVSPATYRDAKVTITITDQNQDRFFGKMVVDQQLNSQRYDIAGVIYNAELHFTIYDSNKELWAIGFGRLSEPETPKGAVSISGYWNGGGGYESALFSVKPEAAGRPGGYPAAPGR
ncbi:MAG: hypothetical protein WCF59_10950 [Desulfobaccales bacterium]